MGLWEIQKCLYVINIIIFVNFFNVFLVFDFRNILVG